VLTYLKIGGWRLALLLNFKVAVLKEGIERIVLGFEDEPGSLPAFVNSERQPSTPETTFSLRSETPSDDEAAEALAKDVLEAAAEVHRFLGPGLLASTYEICLCHELQLRNVPFERKRALPLRYRGIELRETDEIELLVGDRVVVRPLALQSIQPVNHAELLSQLRLGGWPLGILINFNSVRLSDGLRRIVLSRRANARSTV
jgi:GxxExxY protein